MVQEGKFVAIHYVGKLDSGEVFDTCEGELPFEFQVGSGMVIRGLDMAVMGMKVNDEKDIRIEPVDAYGDYDINMLQPVPIGEIKPHFEPQQGMMIEVQMDNGMRIPALINKVTDSEVIIDMNHPLAGQPLNFHIKVLDVNDDAKYPSNCSCCDDGHTEGCSC